MEIMIDLLGKGILIPALGAVVGAICSAVVNRKSSGSGTGGGGSSISNSIRGDGNSITNNLTNSNNTNNVTHHHVHHHHSGKAAQNEAGGVVILGIAAEAILLFAYSIYARTIIFWIWEGGQFVVAAAAGFILVGSIMRTRPMIHWGLLGVAVVAIALCGHEILLNASRAYLPEWAYTANQMGLWQYFWNMNHDFRIYALLQSASLIVLVMLGYAILRFLFTYRPNASARYVVATGVLVSVFLGISYFCASGQAYSMVIAAR